MFYIKSPEEKKIKKNKKNQNTRKSSLKHGEVEKELEKLFSPEKRKERKELWLPLDADRCNHNKDNGNCSITEMAWLFLGKLADLNLWKRNNPNGDRGKMNRIKKNVALADNSTLAPLSELSRIQKRLFFSILKTNSAFCDLHKTGQIPASWWAFSYLLVCFSCVVIWSPEAKTNKQKHQTNRYLSC